MPAFDRAKPIGNGTNVPPIGGGTNAPPFPPPDRFPSREANDCSPRFPKVGYAGTATAQGAARRRRNVGARALDLSGALSFFVRGRSNLSRGRASRRGRPPEHPARALPRALHLPAAQLRGSTAPSAGPVKLFSRARGRLLRRSRPSGGGVFRWKPAPASYFQEISRTSEARTRYRRGRAPMTGQ
jgi:hypothetical protein